MRSIWLAALVAIAGCHGGSKSGGGGEPQNPGSGTKPPPATKAATNCAEAQPILDAMYREAATMASSKRVDDETRDNVEMALRDCKVDEPRFVACLASVHNVRDLEANCIIPLDDEGSEADQLVPGAGSGAH